MSTVINNENNTQAQGAAEAVNTTTINYSKLLGSFLGGGLHSTSITLKVASSAARLIENVAAKGIGMVADAVLKEEFVKNARQGYREGIDGTDNILDVLDKSARRLSMEELENIKFSL